MCTISRVCGCWELPLRTFAPFGTLEIVTKYILLETRNLSRVLPREEEGLCPFKQASARVAEERCALLEQAHAEGCATRRSYEEAEQLRARRLEAERRDRALAALAGDADARALLAREAALASGCDAQEAHRAAEHAYECAPLYSQRVTRLVGSQPNSQRGESAINVSPATTREWSGSFLEVLPKRGGDDDDTAQPLREEKTKTDAEAVAASVAIAAQAVAAAEDLMREADAARAADLAVFSRTLLEKEHAEHRANHADKVLSQACVALRAFF